MSKDKFNIWYNKRLNQVDEEVDESLWKDIEDELDFQETWQNISARLDKNALHEEPPVKKRYFVKELIGIAAGIMLILATAIYLNDQARSVSVIPGNISLNTDYFGEKTKTIADNAFNRTAARNIETDFLTKSATPVFFTGGISDESNLTDPVHTATPNNEVATRQNMSRQPGLFGYIRNVTEPDITFTITTAYSSKIKNFTGGNPDGDNVVNLIDIEDAGLVFGYKNTWLLNYETYNGLNPSKLNSALPTYRQELGIATTLLIKSRTEIGFEFFWRSEVGQNYQQYIDASYMNRNINLDYLKFQSFYIWSHQKVPGEMLFGGYYSILKTGRETQGGTSFIVTRNYSDSDYGILLGYQLKMDINNRLTLKPGIRINYNMHNIFKGDNIIPAHLKKTNSFSAGFNISLAYDFFR